MAVTLTINGIETEAEEGSYVLEAGRKLNIEIPTLCHHHALEPYGACRLCLVEVAKGRRTQITTACNRVVEEGLVIQTGTDRIWKMRRMVLELLLARAPASKELREIARRYGVESTRFPIDDPQNRCILCGLCERACRELVGANAISFSGRGGERKISTPYFLESDFCITCGACTRVCPTGAIQVVTPDGQPIPNEEFFLEARTAVSIPSAQAIPKVPAINPEACIHFKTGECGLCKKVCGREAIDFDQQPEEIELEVGAIVVAPGFKPYDPRRELPQYGYGRFPNVMTSMEYERLLSASGPTHGHVVRPSDGRPPERIAFIQCVGCRDRRLGHRYCSAACCMWATKEAIITKEHDPHADITLFYMDMRSYGKDFDAYVERAKNECQIHYVRCRPSSVVQGAQPGSLLIEVEDEDGTLRSQEFDLVVLTTALVPTEDSRELAEILGIEMDSYGFCKTSEIKPVQTSQEGIFACGPFQEPRDIPETVVQASSAASKVAALLPAEVREPYVKKYPLERDVGDEKPRIGVFVCHCGINIGGTVDVERVRAAAERLPNVVFTTANLYSCSQDAQDLVKEKILEHNLNRVVVAACSPRTHEPLFQETLKEAGINKYLFEMVNIRDQCSWIHAADREEATRKAIDLVRMGVAKARLIEPLPQLKIPVLSKALVIGGGLAGMTASLELAGQGFETYLIERDKELGGNLRNVHYTLQNLDVQRFLQETIARVEVHPLIRVFKGVTVASVEGYLGNFKTTIERPTGKGIALSHGVVIVATGAEPCPTEEYFYGKEKRVVTQNELENLVAGDAQLLRSVRRVVMIQCVGSREGDRLFCSRICCSQAVKNALKLKSLNPGTEVYVLYRDMRTYGLQERYYEKARDEGVIFIRFDVGDKPKVMERNGSLRVLVEEPTVGVTLDLQADLLVLSVGIQPRPDGAEVAKMLKVPLNQDRFFLEAHAKLRPVDFATDGVFLCGLAHSPKTLSESIDQASAAASRAGTILSQEEFEAEGTVSSVNLEYCVGCSGCVGVCPYHALELKARHVHGVEKVVCAVNEALCKGCGTCAAVCPNGAMQQRGFTSRQILSMIHAFSKKE